MARDERELFYERKLRVAMDALDELDRLELEPNLPADQRAAIAEQKPAWEREYALARAQYAGIRTGQSMLPLPPLALREKLGALADQVEKQVNRNKAANGLIAAATALAGMLADLKAIA